MRITWSLPVRGEALSSSRGDLVRARNLIAALRDDGHDVRVVENAASAAARARVSAYRRVRAVMPRAMALTARDIGRRLHSRAHAERVADAARAQHADLIIETQVHFADSGALAARATGIPLVLDDCSPWQEEMLLGCALPGLARRSFDAQARVATRLAVSSQQLRRILIDNGADADRVRVVPNATHAAPRASSDADDVAVRDNRVVLVFAGSFQAWHRVELLVEALALVPDSLPLHTMLVGEGTGRAAVLDALQRMHLAHPVNAPGAVPAEELSVSLAACDIGVLPGSNDYGQPMKLLEYGAAGLPAIAPDLPPVREVLEDGVTGILFQPGDASDLARCITTLARDAGMRSRLGAAARVRATATSWRDSARLLIQDARA